MKVGVGVSNRHVHLTKEVYDLLFDEEISKFRDLDQPLQYAANQRVTLKNGDRVIEGVRLVGPLRDYNQVELSRTDCYRMKLNPPVRDSGFLEGSEKITLVGPKGSAYIDMGVIIANRHIHIKPNELEKYGLQNGELVCVRISGEKAGILENVHLKVQDTAALRLHLDTDDANAFGLKNDDVVEVLKMK